MMKIGRKNGLIRFYGGFILTLMVCMGMVAFAAPPLGDPFTAEFDGFDTVNWHKADGWTNGSMFNCGWKANHVTFSEGNMTLTLDNEKSSGRPYTAGEYRTNKFYHYGTYEVRMKAAKQAGVVSSFFTYTGPSDNQPWDEIDVEILGKDTTKMQVNYFVNGVGGHEGMIALGFDASEDFHTYKIVWMPESIEWYVDDVLVHTAKGKNLPKRPQRIMMNLWPGIGVDGWLQSFHYKQPLKAEYDWVKYSPLN